MYINLAWKNKPEDQPPSDSKSFSMWKHGCWTVSIIPVGGCRPPLIGGSLAVWHGRALVRDLIAAEKWPGVYEKKVQHNDHHFLPSLYKEFPAFGKFLDAGKSFCIQSKRVEGKGSQVYIMNSLHLATLNSWTLGKIIYVTSNRMDHHLISCL